MERNNSYLLEIKKLVKPEYFESLKAILDQLVTEWDKLSDEEKENYYWVYDAIGFIFDDHKDLWKVLPEDHMELLNECTDSNLDRFILDLVYYICLFENDADDFTSTNDPADTDWYDVD